MPKPANHLLRAIADRGTGSWEAVPRYADLALVAVAVGRTARAGLGPFGQPETGQRHSGQADPEFLESLSARYRLGHALGQFVEFVAHSFPFALLVAAPKSLQRIMAFKWAA